MATVYVVTDQGDRPITEAELVLAAGVNTYPPPADLAMYTHQYVAALIGIDCGIPNPRIWSVDYRTTAGGRFRPIEVITWPALPTEKLITCAIRASENVDTPPAWDAWAAAWLSGADRTVASARTASWTVHGLAQMACYAAMCPDDNMAAWGHASSCTQAVLEQFPSLDLAQWLV